MRLIFILLLSVLFIKCSSNKNITSNSKPISHEKWENLLQKNVEDNGCVNYKGFIADSTKLNDYLTLLGSNHPNDKNWSREEKMAYWINAYNAFTIKLITDNYPVKSIKDIGGSIYRVNTPWAKKFITIEGYQYSLDNIEHDILRPKFNEPRVHAAVNCASQSCPILYNHAYIPEKLDSQLTLVFTNFLADTQRNKITKDKLELSKIFSWFSGDFKQDGKSLIDYLNAYTETEINKDASVTYLDYNWSLNECR